MTESANSKGPEFFPSSQGDEPDDGRGERDTEGHRFTASFQGDNENPSQKKDDDTEGHRFMSE